MKQEHFDEFCELIDSVAEMYSKTLTAGSKMIYWQGLFDYDFEDVRMAMFRHIRSTEKDADFMPKVSNIKKMIEGTCEDSALKAWAKVDRGVRQTGPYADVVFDDSLIHRVIHDMGGWIGLGDKPESEWPFVAREFENRYRGYKSKGEIPEYPSILTGISNAYNAINNQPLGPYVMIGNPVDCKKVLSGGVWGSILFEFREIGAETKSLSLAFSSLRKMA